MRFDREDKGEAKKGLRAALLLVASIAGFILVDRLVSPLGNWMIVGFISMCLVAAMLLRRS